MRILNQIHAHILTHPNLPPSSLSFSLVKILCFAAYRNIHYATKLLPHIPHPSIFAYNTVIRGFTATATPSPSPIHLFRNLVRRKFPAANTFTMAFVLKCCAMLPAVEEGKQVHKHVICSGLGENKFVKTSLLNFYTKCREIEMGRKVFDEMPDKNVVAWSAMIGGYAKLGMVNEALEMFREMQKGGVEPDEVTMVSVISACAMTGALDLGKWLHAFIDKKRICKDLEVNTALVNMYAKCGCIEKAYEVFDAMPVKDAKAWTSMIVGFAIHGLANDALDTFEKMGEAQVEPNLVTLIGVLSACAHGGLVSEGRKYWSSMVECGIEPSMEHYGCMVDLFCRTNRTEEAFLFVANMPIAPNPAIWRTLLVSGCSSIEINGHVHEFVMGRWSHPWIASVLQNVGDGEKQDALWEHSERLAIAYGLLKTKAPAVIKIVKNLRACIDCHEVTKTISKLYNREIIVRDRIRFHRFVNGVCSCQDFW